MIHFFFLLTGYVFWGAFALLGLSWLFIHQIARWELRRRARLTELKTL